MLSCVFCHRYCHVPNYEPPLTLDDGLPFLRDCGTMWQLLRDCGPKAKDQAQAKQLDCCLRKWLG